MSSLDQVIAVKCAALGYTGSTHEQMIKLFKANGATSDNLNEAYIQFAAARGVSTTGRTLGEILNSLASAYSGTLQERLIQYWANLTFGYDQFCTNAAGQTVGTTFFTNPTNIALQDADSNGSVTAGDQLTALTFSNVTLTTCSSATLTILGMTPFTPGFVGAFVQSSGAAEPVFSDPGNLPSAAIVGALGPALFNVAAPGTATFNLTSAIASRMGAAGWASGNRLNIVLFPITPGAFVVGGDPDDGVTCRLQITP